MTHAQYFEVKKRHTTGGDFTCLTDNAPQELKDFVRSIHFDYFCGCLSNDWIYATIHQAFDDLEENSLENITIEPDTYNNQLYKWLYENGNAFATALCDEYVEEICSDCNDLNKIISGGQWLAMDKIYRAVADFMEEMKAEKEA